jgi:hypothetical protein
MNIFSEPHIVEYLMSETYGFSRCNWSVSRILPDKTTLADDKLSDH